MEDKATTLEDIFGSGNLEVWYCRPEFSQFGRQGARPNHNPNCLIWTHIKLGSIPQMKRHNTEDVALDEMWVELQGERWSPNGEARDLIRFKGLEHTSMSVGDCFRLSNGEVHMVAADGFERVDS